ncbi:MAG: transketolase [Planctomycetota bacterium]
MQTLADHWLDADEVDDLAHRLRVHTVEMTHRAKSSHVGSSLSMAELLAVLYGRVLRIDPQNPEAPDRDRFILSKGHACAALYATLAERGFFPLSWLESFYHNGAKLPGHATAKGIPGIEVSTGSLGHGLPIATGMAWAAKKAGAMHRVYCLLSDGECDEGSNWEAALFAPHHLLGNLTVIVDYNKIQSLGHCDKVCSLEPFTDKWAAFGWRVESIDGHDTVAVERALRSAHEHAEQPTCVIANTVKGKGVSFMEDSLLWHYRTPQGEEYEAAMAELADRATRRAG